jgi:glutamine synthetase
LRWDGLCRFLDDGRVEIDSNVVELAIRPITLGRKNHLFAGSDGGARHWAVLASLIAALMRRYDTIAEICDAMQLLGWQPYQSDHEDANGQFEMNWQYDGALVTADRHSFFKYMIRSIGGRHGLRATFMPKFFGDLTGNGCHPHVSLWTDGKSLFHDPFAIRS